MAVSWLGDELVRGKRQKLFKAWCGREALEQLTRDLELAGLDAELARDHDELLLDDLAEPRGGDDLAGVEWRLVVDPLPDLRARDLGGRGVLHQVVDRDAALAAQPGLEIEDADA